MRPVADTEALEQAVQAMRRLGVTRWGDIELGPDPAADAPREQMTPTRTEAERRERDERKHVALAASGGLVRRLPSGQ